MQKGKKGNDEVGHDEEAVGDGGTTDIGRQGRERGRDRIGQDKNKTG